MPGIIDNYWQFDNSNGLRSAHSHKIQCVHRKVQLWGWKTWQPGWQRYIPLVYLPQNQTSTVDSYIKAPLEILKLCLLCSATDLKKSWVDLHKWTFAQCAACYLQHCTHINSHLSPVLLVNNHHVSQPLQPPGSCEDSWTCSLGETKAKGLLPGSIALVFASLWLRFLEIEGNVQRCN